jgi:hypothetical protein
MADPNNNLQLFEKRFKVIVHEQALNRAFQRKIVDRSEDLEYFRVSFHPRFAQIQGMVRVRPEWNRKWIRLTRLGFRILLFSDDIRDNVAGFHIRKFSLFNPNQTKVDFIKFYGKLSNRIQERLISIFGKLKTPITFQTSLRSMTVDMNTFAQSFDTLAPFIGQVELDYCYFQSGNMVFFARSNVILRSLIEMFGPQYLTVEELDPGTDIYQALWNR